MAIKPFELLRFAKSIVRNEAEVFQRSAASRAYYSCLLASREAASHVDWAAVPGGMHERVIRYYTAHPSRAKKSVGYILIELRSLRVVADYELSRDFTCEDARKAISFAERCHGRLASQ